MATKILRVFQEFTSEGYVPMPPAGNIDYGYTIAGTFPSTTPATFQTDNPDLEVTVTEVTDFYVWIRSHGTEWNYQYTRNVRVYPDSPSINNVVMGIIIANLGNTVPYTGATKNVDLGEFGISGGYVHLDNTPTTALTTAGTIKWNDVDGTADLILKGGNVTNQIGQEINKRVVNKTGAILNEADFRAVRIRLVSEGGAQGQRLAVVLAQADSDTNSATTIGLVTETIANNQEGFITLIGEVKEINTTGAKSYGGTETWSDGDILYLSPTHAGYLTNVKPQAPQHTIIIGFVSYAHAIHGKIDVKVDNGYELDELHNVKITSATENDFLVYDGTQHVWENRAVIKANGYIPYFDSTDLFKQSPILVDGVNVTMNGMPLLLSDEGQLNYITKFGSTKTVINSLLYDTGTKIGINTTNPEYLFTVVGGAMGVYSSSTNYGYIDTANTSMRLVSANGFNFTANNIGTIANTRVDANGNWGFGIGTPAYKVDVNGDVNTNGIYRINGSPLSTSNIAEGTNLYFTSNRVLGQVLTGLNVSLTGVVTAADSLIVGISKLQNQVSSIVSGVSSVFGRTGAVTAQSGDYTTAQVTESGNLYYTDARARGAISAGSGISYNNTTGVIASTITQYTDAMARASLSFVAGSGAYNSTTGVITIPTNTNQLTNGANYITLASLSASSPLSYNSGTGAFSISQASGTTNGFLSSTDWTTFNNKQNALGYTPVPTTRTITINGTTQDLSADRTFTVAGTISGLTTNYITKATSATTLGNSLIYDNGSKIGIGTTSPIGYSADDLVLQIYNSATGGSAMRSMLRFTNTTTGTAFGGGSFLGIDSTLDLYVVNSSNANIQFQTNGLERLRITSGGNVGIGTTSPSAQLHATGSVIIGSAPSSVFKFNVNPTGSNFISFWIPTIGGVNSNGIISHGGGGYTNQLPLGYFATQHIFNGEVTGGGAMQVAGDVNITGSFRVNNVPITSGGGATSLAGLTDVSIASPTNGQILVYDSSTSKWKNQANSASGITGSGSTNYIPKYSGNTSLGNSSLFQLPDNTGILFNSTIATSLAGKYFAINDLNYSQFACLINNTLAGRFWSADNYSAFAEMRGYPINFIINTSIQFIVKSNTVNIQSMPSSTSGLSFGDLYVDANGFVKRYNVV